MKKVSIAFVAAAMLLAGCGGSDDPAEGNGDPAVTTVVDSESSNTAGGSSADEVPSVSYINIPLDEAKSLAADQGLELVVVESDASGQVQLLEGFKEDRVQVAVNSENIVTFSVVR